LSNEWLTRHTLLMRATDQNDEAAWKEFVSYYKEFIMMVLAKMSVSQDYRDDLTQEILIKLWKNLASYNKERAHFRTWLSTIIRNTVFRMMKTEDRKHFYNKQTVDQDDPKAVVQDFSESMLDSIINSEWEKYITSLALEKVKDSLSQNASEILILSLKEVPIEDICEKLKLKLSSAKVLKSRAQTCFMQEVRQLNQL
jgi:RNA polymerase sigma factor (sigma-70 family)